MRLIDPQVTMVTANNDLIWNSDRNQRLTLNCKQTQYMLQDTKPNGQ